GRVARGIRLTIAALVRTGVTGRYREGLPLRNRNLEQGIHGLHHAIAALVGVRSPLASAEGGVDHLRRRFTDGGRDDLVQRIDQRIAVSTIGRVEGQALHAPAHAQDALAVHVPLGRALVVIAVAGRIADGGAAQAFTRVPVDAIGIGADHVDRTRGDAAAGGEVIEVSDGLLHAAPTPYADIHVGGGRQRRGIVDVREFLRIVPANAHHARGIGLHH